MRKRWFFVKEGELLGTYRARRRTRSRRLLLFRKTHFYAEPTAVIDLHGKLQVGCRWECNGFLPSQLVLQRDARLTVRGFFQIYTGCWITINPGAHLVLGRGYVNSRLNLACYERIEIGNDVAIGENVTLRDSDTYSLDPIRPATAPIVIGNDVWVGLNSTILKGVTIGDGAVVAAGSVVIRDVPPRSLVAGVPATVKRTGVTWRHSPCSG